MPDLVDSAIWEDYKELIGIDAADTFFQDEIIWKKANPFLDKHGEDEIGETFVDVILKCLVDYNDFRTWPITRNTETGEIDKQTAVVIFSLKTLKDLGFLNANGNFDYDSDEDRFELDGILYKSMGDTNTAQAQNEPLLFQLVVERELTLTSEDNN